MADEQVIPEGGGAPATTEVGAAPSQASIDFPSSWRSEDRQHWDAAPDDVRKIIAAREANWAKESEQYKGAHQNWSRYEPVIKRYDRLFRDEGVDPDQGIQNVLQLAHNLRYGDAATKKRILESLNGYYGDKEEKPREWMDPEVGEVHSTLHRELSELKQGLMSMQQVFRGYVEDDTRREIAKFAKNPEHKHFDKLDGMMGKMIKSGLAADMEEAYGMALKIHPELVSAAQKEQTTQKADVKGSQTRQALQAAGVNVRGGGRAPEGAKPRATLRKSIEQMYDKVSAKQ